MSEREINLIVKYYDLVHSTTETKTSEEIAFLQEFNNLLEENATLKSTTERLIQLSSASFSETMEKLRVSLNEIEGPIKNDGANLIAKKFGIDISLVEEYHLQAGTNIYKFTNPANGGLIVLEDTKDKPLLEQLNEIQNANKSLQSGDSKENTYGTLEEMEKSNGNKLEYISFEDINKYSDILAHMTIEETKKLDYLRKRKVQDPRKFEKINLKTLTILDSEGKIYEPRKDLKTGNYSLYEPEKAEYLNKESDTTKIINVDDGSTYTSTNENDSRLIDEYNKLDESNKKVLIELVEDPKLISIYSEEQQAMLQKLVEKYKVLIKKDIERKKAEEERQRQEDIAFMNQIGNEAAKTYVLTLGDNRKAGYIDALILSFITGIAGGIMLTIGFLILTR